ncbi:hypothetical protein BT93_L2215 [Corymbia citriodora subsp. variegata]|uniref:Uncharacterized protein n=1 Tax=Corymbia citriodora subsp. variegata TaxID=360336 RepID=A0A8T0CKJ7_CORYI|nr:hypothetical protein BT93_L2215 [Corymbia citriodora subsp. variegata]
MRTHSLTEAQTQRHARQQKKGRRKKTRERNESEDRGEELDGADPRERELENLGRKKNEGAEADLSSERKKKKSRSEREGRSTPLPPETPTTRTSGDRRALSAADDTTPAIAKRPNTAAARLSPATCWRRFRCGGHKLR